jgi:hypothetical protein
MAKPHLNVAVAKLIPTMPTPLEKFQSLLRELFQFEQADLDFGVHRIMSPRRTGRGFEGHHCLDAEFRTRMHRWSAA